ncbi:MAG TPA: hypothetical protein VFF72_09825, partial [Caldimonas sp.]|nr:hypothetical protein [Caldimonas sp.]
MTLDRRLLSCTLASSVLLVACAATPITPAPAPAAPARSVAEPMRAPGGAPAATAASARASTSAAPSVAIVDPKDLVPPAPARFEDAVARAGRQLFMQAQSVLGPAPRLLVVDPLIDANTGG